MILAGDIGGTNTRIAIFKEDGERLQSVAEQIFPSQDHKNLEEIVSAFLSSHKATIRRACFGIAGPVRDGRCEATNLPWIVDARALSDTIGLQSVELVNDLEANAYGIATLDAADFKVLNEGDKVARGNKAIISAGTGLGEAGLYWDGSQHHPFACEGGHSDFAPRNELEIELLRFLLERFEHVSYEHIVSGPGLFNIYTFLRDTGCGEEEKWLADEMQLKDPSRVISAAALDGKSELCMRTLELFVLLYGAEAGNLALKVMATGGLYIGGGIAPKIIRERYDRMFMEAFTSKGRMKSMVASIPVRVILNDKTALRGAARCATRR